MLQPLASPGEDDGGFHVPTIAEFFPPTIFGEGTFYEFDRIMMVRVIMALALVLIFWLGSRHLKVVPGRGQNLVEMAADFVRVQIAELILGAKARPFVPMLTVIFYGILAMNIAGVIPLLNIAGTSRVGLPVLLALWVYVMYLAQGVMKHGLGGYLKASLFPPGVPPFMYVLITPIEILQVFVLRPFTLALRLTANMIAGHLMLVLGFAGTQYLVFEAGGAIKAAGALTFTMAFGISLFEVLVAVLQAFIFTILTAVYINMALEEEH